jgi:WD40 repeat protein/transcriptional regulator with XRE-family HTH domain
MRSDLLLNLPLRRHKMNGEGINTVREKPFSPASFETFGDLLKYLRRRERLTQLELSIAVGYSEAHVGRLEKNQRRPDPATVKALFVLALHLENEPELMVRLLELAQTSREEDAPAPGISPYKGLLFFDESDADLFFGRENLTAHLAKRVSGLASDSPLHFLAVVGASGSGKSSLVRAGLAVALKQASWDVRIFTPGDDPLKALEMQFELGQGPAGPGRLLILVDQFEEVFTACHNESGRASFIEKLFDLAQEPSGNGFVVIALRADFYSHCAQYPILRQAVAANQEYIGQMTVEELRRAIEQPAKRGGWELESGLVDLLLHDIGAYDSGEPEPGALPLLSHALLATWERRRGRKFTLAGYHATGGVRGAIAETAESLFTDQLNQTQQGLAREVFLRLTELGEGTEDTRRRATLNELVRGSTETTQLTGVLNTLAEARLITINADSAEVAHEALIREWQRLHEWLTQDREGLQLHRHLTEAAHEWELLERDPGALYRGSRLAQAREWEAQHPTELNIGEKAFLNASIEWEQREAREREAQRQRELEAAQKLAETQEQAAARLRIRNRLITSVGVIALVLAVLTGIFALSSNQQRNSAQSAQATAQVASTQAVADFTRAEAQRIAVESNNLMLNNGDPNLIALLAIRSLALQYTPAGDAALSSVTNLQAPPRELKGHTKPIIAISISPDGKYLATASEDSTARLWDIATGQTIRTFTGHTDKIEGIAFSPDGKNLVTVSYDQTIRLWDVASGQTLKIIQGTGEMYDVAFSPQGRFIITSGANPPDPHIWDVVTGQAVHILTGHTGPTTLVAYSPDGKYVLTGSMDTTARLWDAATGEQLKVFTGPVGVDAVGFTPDGKFLLTGSEDDTTRLWNPVTGQMVREFPNNEPPGSAINNLTVSPDGKYLVTVSYDRTARLWDLATGQFIRYFGGRPGVLEAVKFTPDGKQVVIAGDDNVARIWSMQTFQGGMVFSGHTASLREVAFSPDGKLVVTASEDHTARIWDPANGQTVMILKGHTAEVYGAVFSPDGRQVLTSSVDGTARLWDAVNGAELRRFVGHTDTVNKAIFSPDGKYVVTASYDGTARVWDAQTAQTLVIYRSQGPGHINRIAFSPDGKTVATSGDDGTVRIWDPVTGKELMVFKGYGDIVSGVAFSPDGKTLAASSNDSTLRLWDVASGKEIRRFLGHVGRIFGAAFSPDGKYLLSTGEDGTARLWDVQTGQEVRRFTGHTDLLRNAVFSPDGKYILTSSNDNTARLWLTNLSDTIHAVCALLTRDLTPQERIQFEITDPGPTCPVP